MENGDSPFRVSSGADDGYIANEAVLGLGLRRGLDEMTSPVDVFTKSMLFDLQIDDYADLRSWAAGSEALDRGVRGIGEVAFLSEGFVTDLPFDSYKVERIESDRMMSSSAWIFDGATGVFDQQLKQGDLRRDFGQVQFRVDGSGGVRKSPRSVFDLNKVLVSDRLALRLVGLDENAKGSGNGFEGSQERLFGSVVIAPWNAGSLVIAREGGNEEKETKRVFSMAEQRFRNWEAVDFETSRVRFDQSWLKGSSGFSLGFVEESIEREFGQLFSGYEQTQETEVSQDHVNQYWRAETFGTVDFGALFEGRPQLGSVLGKHMLRLEWVSADVENRLTRETNRYEFREAGEIVDEGESHYEYAGQYRTESLGISFRSDLWEDRVGLMYRWVDDLESRFEGQRESVGFVYKVPENWIPKAIESNVSLFGQVQRGATEKVWERYDFQAVDEPYSRSKEIGLRWTGRDGRFRASVSHFAINRQDSIKDGLSIVEASVNEFLLVEFADAVNRELGAAGSGRGEAEGIIDFFGGEIDFEAGRISLPGSSRYGDLLDGVTFEFVGSDFYYSSGNLAVRDWEALRSSGWELALEYRADETFQAKLNVSTIRTRRALGVGTTQFLSDFEARFDQSLYTWWSEFAEDREAFLHYHLIDKEIDGTSEWVINGLARYAFTEGAWKGASIGVKGTWDEAPAQHYESASVMFRGYGMGQGLGSFPGSQFDLGFWLGYEREVWGGRANWRVRLALDNATAHENLYSRSRDRGWSLSNTLSF